MNKIIWISAAVLSVAACAKNEVIPVNSGENQEITFNVAPKTKADPDGHGHTEFGKDKVFASWAYYLPTGTDWEHKSDNPNDEKYPKEYISGAEIAYREKTEGSEEKVWKAKKTYYWPKNGSLTFFAYSLYKDNLDFKTVNVEGDDIKRSTVVCHSNTGIFAHIDLSVDNNVDFLVADPAMDKKSNVDKDKHFVDGVPTLFRHKLSYIIFNVKTDNNYSDAGKTLTLKSIKFNNVSYVGEYRDIASTSPAISAGFTSANGEGAVVNYTGGSTESPFSQEIKSTNSGISSIDNYLYIPQTFEQGSNAYIEVKYTITTTVAFTTPEGQPSTKEVVEEVTKNIFLNPATGTPMFDKWEMGKKYTINLTFTLDEILWDPAVEDWDPVTPATDRVVE
ncbi:MAG: fimbrillin family protein [Bacteroidales bacterium]|nr:fimbrillin family protein [Bacteroidales bacterium]